MASAIVILVVAVGLRLVVVYRTNAGCILVAIVICDYASV